MSFAQLDRLVSPQRPRGEDRRRRGPPEGMVFDVVTLMRNVETHFEIEDEDDDQQ